MSVIPSVRNKRSGQFAAVMVLALVMGCSEQKVESPLPGEIYGLKLEKATTGEAAAAMLARLHRKQVAPSESYIGHYGTGPSHAMLYVSRFENKGQAQALLRDMSARIGKGSSGFGHHQQFRVDGREVHLVLGQGQVHYFYADGAYLFWLGMDPRMARAGLAELLEVDVDKVPTVESLMSGLQIL